MRRSIPWLVVVRAMRRLVPYLDIEDVVSRFEPLQDELGLTMADFVRLMSAVTEQTGVGGGCGRREYPLVQHLGRSRALSRITACRASLRFASFGVRRAS